MGGRHATGAGGEGEDAGDGEGEDEGGGEERGGGEDAGGGEAVAVAQQAPHVSLVYESSATYWHALMRFWVSSIPVLSMALDGWYAT